MYKPESWELGVWPEFLRKEWWKGQIFLANWSWVNLVGYYLC